MGVEPLHAPSLRHRPFLIDLAVISAYVYFMERFWAKVDGTGKCWEWRSVRNNSGYGLFHVKREGRWTSTGAHRMAWELANGPIPEGVCVLHRCDNRGCVNPSHLFLGTHKDNSDDCFAKGRRAKKYRAHTRVRKLTDGQVRKIRSDERRYYEIAYEFGVSEVTVCNIKKGRRKALVC